MSSVIDKRRYSRNPETANRKKFLKRCKDAIRDRINDEIDKRSITDPAGDVKVREASGGLDEPSFSNDPTTGTPPRSIGNNREHQKGDRVSVPKPGDGEGEASDEAAEFEFILTKKEFLDILFEDMELPNYVKESLNTDVKYRWRRAGVCEEGPIPRLNIYRTMMASFARRRATREYYENQDPPRKAPFVTEEDMKYNLYQKEKENIHKAVMFAVMDVSGSMGDHEKALAKRFFLLLHLFLSREYDNVDVRFIIHNTEAIETDESSFFHVSEGGGTIVRSAFELINKIIEDEYDISKVNIYISQVSDGDDFESEATLNGYLEENILPKVQYFAYLQAGMSAAQYMSMPTIFRERLRLGGLYRTYMSLRDKYDKFNIGAASDLTEVFPVLQKLFKKES